MKAAGTVRLTVGAGHFLSIRPDDHLSRRSRLGNRGVHLDSVPAGRKLVAAAGLVAVDDHHVVLVDQLALVHIQGQAARGAAERIQDAGCVSGRSRRC